MINKKYNLEEVIKEIKESNICNDKVKWGELVIQSLLTGDDYPQKCMDEYNRLRDEKGIEEESEEFWSKALYTTKEEFEKQHRN